MNQTPFSPLRHAALPILLCLSACDGADESSVEGTDAQGTSTEPSAGGTPGDSTNPPPPGQGEPNSGDGTGTCEMTHMSKEKGILKDGEGVEISGTVTWSGSPANLLIEVIALSDDGNYGLINHECPRPGPFNIEVPKNAGKIHLLAYVDGNNNGPSDDDPAGRTKKPLPVGDEPITNVEITVTFPSVLGGLQPMAVVEPELHEPDESGGEGAEGEEGAEPSSDEPSSPEDAGPVPPPGAEEGDAPPPGAEEGDE